MGIHLIVDYYQDSRPARAEEFLTCLRKNLGHPEVECVWNLGGRDALLPDDIRRHEKYRCEPLGDRLTFHQAVAFANERLSSCFVGIINLDIYLDTPSDGWGPAENLVRQSNVVLCQSRVDLQADGTLTRDPGYARLAFANTQDGWFFVPPLDVPNIDFELGTLGCDNAFAHRLTLAGKVPVNMGSRYRLIHVDLCRGKHAGNANAVHATENATRQSTYSSYPEREGCYLVPDIDLLGDLESVAKALNLTDLQKYRMKCDMLSQIIKINN